MTATSRGLPWPNAAPALVLDGAGPLLWPRTPASHHLLQGQGPCSDCPTASSRWTGSVLHPDGPGYSCCLYF